MYVCMCICIYVHMYVCIFACVKVLTCGCCTHTLSSSPSSSSAATVVILPAVNHTTTKELVVVIIPVCHYLKILGLANKRKYTYKHINTHKFVCMYVYANDNRQFYMLKCVLCVYAYKHMWFIEFKAHTLKHFHNSIVKI